MLIISYGKTTLFEASFDEIIKPICSKTYRNKISFYTKAK